MHRTWTAALALLLAGSAAAGQTRDPAAAALAGITPGPIAAHLSTLAHDSLEGRAPGTRGGRLAADYVAAQLARAGLQPLAGQWLHPVPLAGWTADTAATFLAAGSGSAAVRLPAPDDVVLWSPAAARRTRVEAPLVFAGFGIVAPEYGWNDYGRPVRGRVVLVLAGEPPAPADRPDRFEGEALTWYGRWTYKVEEAVRQGAAAVLLVHTAGSAGYDWDVVRSSWGGEVLSLAADSLAAPGAVGWIRFDAAKRLLEQHGHSLDELVLRARRGDGTPMDVAPAVRINLGGRARRFESPNVIGVLPGRHAVRGDEYVAYTAHYDHLGIGRARAGDSIHNGAYDNASGVALLLAIAQAAARTPPERSLLFIATTAEEAGMLGARHLVRQPPVPLERMIAAINIDGANLWGETEDIGALGAERSTLGEAFARSVARLALRAVAERAPQLGFFFRSDQFIFARAGIPALAIEHGLEYRGREPGWGDAVVGEYLARHYHAPSDEFRASFDLRGAVQQARAALLFGLELANTLQRPAWYPGARIAPPAPGGQAPVSAARGSEPATPR